MGCSSSYKGFQLFYFYWDFIWYVFFWRQPSQFPLRNQSNRKPMFSWGEVAFSDFVSSYLNNSIGVLPPVHPAKFLPVSKMPKFVPIPLWRAYHRFLWFLPYLPDNKHTVTAQSPDIEQHIPEKRPIHLVKVHVFLPLSPNSRMKTKIVTAIHKFFQ